MEHTYKSSDIEFPLQRIEERDMEKEVKTSFIEYSMSVITSRALPDVRDGMKPGQRRILYAMYEDNLTHDKPFRKSATTVGNVLGRYHPHGDSAVYGTMVRMAQDFSLRYTLVEGHGNFGNVDGDPPAAYRYTEARMSRIANHMMTDIEKNVVPMVRNFDNTRDEPTVLPSRFPNLLVNGSVGIAVGMATNIPPHNLSEVVDGSSVRIVDYAVKPSTRSGPSYTKNTVLGMLVGIVVSGLVIVIREMYDVSIREEEYLSETYGIPVLAAIPDTSQRSSGSYSKYSYKSSYYYGTNYGSEEGKKNG
mgnify:CR=1 FL=1